MFQRKIAIARRKAWTARQTARLRLGGNLGIALIAELLDGRRACRLVDNRLAHLAHLRLANQPIHSHPDGRRHHADLDTAIEVFQQTLA